MHKQAEGTLPHPVPLLWQHAWTGAALLDLIDHSWWTVIDVDALNMGDPQKCVIGQLAMKEDRGYHEYLRYHFLFDAFEDYDHFLNVAYSLGFHLDRSQTSVSYAVLTEIWRSIITYKKSLFVNE